MAVDMKTRRGLIGDAAGRYRKASTAETRRIPHSIQVIKYDALPHAWRPKAITSLRFRLWLQRRRRPDPARWVDPIRESSARCWPAWGLPLPDRLAPPTAVSCLTHARR